jgi:hypothetical protein
MKENLKYKERIIKGNNKKKGRSTAHKKECSQEKGELKETRGEKYLETMTR